MKLVQAEHKTRRALKTAQPSEELSIAVTFRSLSGGLRPTRLDARVSSASVGALRPNPLDVDRALHELHRRGFVVSERGALTASIRGNRKLFEKVFGTKLDVFRINPTQQASSQAFYYPPEGAPWQPDPAIMNLIDDAYIQWPHIFMAGKKPPKTKPKSGKASATSGPASAQPLLTPPTVNYFHLQMPNDVPRLLNAAKVHAAGTTGKGVRIAMIDSGFAHSHPYFAAHGYSSSVVLAASATNNNTDKNGHGTGESANVFAVAPGATFIGVKTDDDNDPNGGASILEGLQEALKHNPHVISVSMGYDLCETDAITGQRTSNKQLTQLPNSLKALEVEVQAAVASGIIVVFSAGNGHVSFPGMMPEVISAGGVYVDGKGEMRASDYASAFASRIYSGRNVPDFCGLVGLQPNADYIMLPVPSGCEIDQENSAHDGTTASDGWGVFSGTSAAAPQLAGACALLLEKSPSLKPSEIKALLKRSARDVVRGSANAASNEDHPGLKAGPGEDGATGAGLVDVFAAWQQL
ncbi:MAG TPA: S8 family serine peptidase [Candidatus Angelobacter sp.]|nr:S8 family serine peptidase [Candidatus Angelobacter sp.]